MTEPARTASQSMNPLVYELYHGMRGLRRGKVGSRRLHRGRWSYCQGSCRTTRRRSECA